jgi:hypothetical protein
MIFPQIAIVILNWNGQKLLEEFLPVVIANSNISGVRVVVADNASADGSVAFVKEHYPNVEVIVLDCNYGFAGGYNRALALIEADYYLLLNSDVAPAEGWMEALVMAVNKYPDAAVFSPKLLSYREPHLFEYAGAAGGFIDKYGFPFCRGRLFNAIETDERQYDTESDIFWASGAAFLIKSSLYREVGGLDEDFFAHMEEIDLCWRLKNRGYRVVYVPKSAVYHVGGATLHQSHPQKTFLNFRNNLSLLCKNLPPQKLAVRLFLRMALDGIAAVKFLLSLEFGFFWAVLRAHLSFYHHLPQLLKKRNGLKAYKLVNQHPEIYSGSIVYDFFFKGIRRFEQLKFKP